MSFRDVAIVLDPPVFEFKTVVVGEIVEQVICVENSSGENLELVSLRSSCGCARAHLADELIRGGEHCDLTVALRGVAGMRQGGAVAHIALVLKGLESGEVFATQIPVIVKNISGITFVPPFVDFGQVSDANVEAVFYVQCTGGERAGLPHFSVHSDCKWLEIDSSYDELSYSWRVRVFGNAPVGAIESSVVVRVGDKSNSI